MFDVIVFERKKFSMNVLAFVSRRSYTWKGITIMATLVARLASGPREHTLPIPTLKLLRLPRYRSQLPIPSISFRALIWVPRTRWREPATPNTWCLLSNKLSIDPDDPFADIGLILQN